MSPDWNRRSILRFIAEGCTLGEAARLVGIHRQTLLRWRWDNPEFSERVAEALALGKVERTYRMWLRHVRRHTGCGYVIHSEASDLRPGKDMVGNRSSPTGWALVPGALRMGEMFDAAVKGSC